MIPLAATALVALLQPQLPGATVRAAVLEGNTPCALTAAELASPARRSGRQVVHVTDACGNRRALFVTLTLTARAIVLTQDVKPGDTLADKTTVEERELSRVPALTAVPRGATATRKLAKGRVLTAADVTTAPPAGSPVTIEVQAGAVTLSRPGVAVACGRTRGCARTGQGKLLTGTWDGGRLLVEAR